MDSRLKAFAALLRGEVPLDTKIEDIEFAMAAFAAMEEEDQPKPVMIVPVGLVCFGLGMPRMEVARWQN